MDLRQQMFMVLMSSFSVVVIVWFIRRSMIDLRYCLLWVGAASSLVLFALFPDLLQGISDTVGIKTPVNALFMIGFYFLAAIVFSLLILFSKASLRIRKLGQDIAILQEEMEKQKQGGVRCR